jgi:hypothetical protein
MAKKTFVKPNKATWESADYTIQIEDFFIKVRGLIGSNLNPSQSSLQNTLIIKQTLKRFLAKL